MATYGVEGIVLKLKDFSEADRLITLFTKQKGKIKVLAKGARKMGSRKGSHLDLLNLVKLYIAQGKTLDIITEAESIEVFPNLKKDLNKVGLSYTIVEIIDQFTQEGEDSYKIYLLLRETMSLLDKEDIEVAKVVLRGFEVKILNLSGFRPQLVQCVRCSRLVVRENCLFVPELGGVVHLYHQEGMLFGKQISFEAIEALKFLQDQPLEKIKDLKFTDSLGKELEQLLTFYIEYLLEKELKSAKFVENLPQ